jgi:hypothetical protein
MSQIQFHHKMAAHCESGMLSALLAHNGLTMSEPMIFGAAGAIFFVFIKTPHMVFPVFDMRNRPGDIRKNLGKRLGIKFSTQKFRDPDTARASLEALIDKGIPTTVQVDMFYMDYIPSYMRVHFNAHFIVVVGKEGRDFLVSDCYYPSISRLSSESLDKARFAKSDFAPRGFQFHVESVPRGGIGEDVLKKAVLQGIKQAASNMVKLPVPFVGIKGMRRFADNIPAWPKIARNTDALSHAIMSIHITLEERGTGGGGFRFMYASFLQEAAKLLNRPELADMSKKIMAIGDRWRELSLFVARIGKDRDLGDNRMQEIRQMVRARADEEEIFFRQLLTMVK